MKAYQQEFIELAIQYEALKFGDFTLKSGRQSPYFFNIGCLSDGEALRRMGTCFAHCIQDCGIPFDGLFGPAYKGIPIASTTAVMLSALFERSTQVTFNRKEVKAHGEGGQLIGAPLSGQILLLDDVITAGTAIGECMPLFQASGAQLAGVVIALNRQERGKGTQNAATEVSERYSVPVISIITLEHIIEYLGAHAQPEMKQAVIDYQAKWSAA